MQFCRDCMKWHFYLRYFVCSLKNSNFATYSSIKDGRNQETI